MKIISFFFQILIKKRNMYYFKIYTYLLARAIGLKCPMVNGGRGGHCGHSRTRQGQKWLKLIPPKLKT
jgi:hypothetical protein